MRGPSAAVAARRPVVAPEDVAAAACPEADFRGFYDRWLGHVLRWIQALGGAEADRQDIAQEVFLVVRRRLHAFDGGNTAGWLYQIARRQVRDFRRRAWIKHVFTREHSDATDALPDRGSSPAATLEHKQRRQVLRAILSKMNEDRRAAFVLFEIEGLSGDEIARIQNVPINTVWQRLHVARKEFFKLVEKHRRASREET